MFERLAPITFSDHVAITNAQTCRENTNNTVDTQKVIIIYKTSVR